MKKSILTLTILGLISALLLSFAHQLLTPIIASRQEEGKRISSWLYYLSLTTLRY